MCGDDIDVPERNAQVGAAPSALAPEARIATPGAEMSGLRMSLPSASTGPRDENPATCGVGTLSAVRLSGWNVAVAPAVAA